MNTNKTVLITGAAGFVGTWLANALFEAGYTLIGLDLRGPEKPEIWLRFSTSSCQTADLDELLHDQSLFAVCHLAGGASVAASTHDPFGDFSNLLPGTARIALYLIKYQPQARMLLFSSAAVYGNPNALPITEAFPVIPISPYGIHKASAETLLNHYSRSFGLPVTVFRIFSVFGPGLRKQLIWDVSRHALQAKEKGAESFTLFGTGRESRDFIYIADLCNAVLVSLAHQQADNYEVYNLASGVESYISDIVDCLLKYLHVDVKPQFNGVVPKGDPVNWRADTSRIKSIGFETKYTLDEGLEQVVNWVRQIH